MTTLDLEEAVALMPHLPQLVQMGVSAQAFSTPESLGPYLRLACEAAREQGLYVEEGGKATLEPGTAVTPEQSADRFVAAVRGNFDLVWEADELIRKILPAEVVKGLVMRSAYELGYRIDVELLPPEAPSA